MRRIRLPNARKRRVVHKRLYTALLPGPGLTRVALCGTPGGGQRSTESWARVSCGKCLTQQQGHGA